MSIRYPTYERYRKNVRRVARRKHEQFIAMAKILERRNRIIESAFKVIEAQAALIEDYAEQQK